MPYQDWEKGDTGAVPRTKFNANVDLCEAHQSGGVNPHTNHLYQDYLTIYYGLTVDASDQIVKSVRAYGESSDGYDNVVLRGGTRILVTQSGDQITIAYDPPGAGDDVVVRIDPPFAWPRMDAQSGVYYQSDFGLIDTEYDGSRLYEEWSSSDAVQHEAFAVIPWRVPNDFGSWAAANAFVLNYWTTDVSGTADVSVRVKKNGVTVLTDLANTTAGAWGTIAFTGASLGSWSVGDIMMVELTLNATNTVIARVGSLELTYQAAT